MWFGNKTKPGPIYGNYRNGKGKARGYDVYGREEPGYIWQEYMNSYLNGKPVVQFSDAKLMTGVQPAQTNPPPTGQNTPQNTDSQDIPTDTGRPTRSRDHQPTDTSPTDSATPTDTSSTGGRNRPGPGGG